MNKQELLDSLAIKYAKVGTPQHISTAELIKNFIVGVWDISNGNALRSNIGFYVENEGKIEEEAYWQGREPKPTVSIGFTQEVNNYITSKINDKTIEAGFVEVINSENETAKGKAYFIVGSDVEEKNILIDKDAGNIRHRVII